MGNIVIAKIPKCGLEKRCAKLQIYSDQTPVLISSERRKKGVGETFKFQQSAVISTAKI